MQTKSQLSNILHFPRSKSYFKLSPCQNLHVGQELAPWWPPDPEFRSGDVIAALWLVETRSLLSTPHSWCITYMFMLSLMWCSVVGQSSWRLLLMSGQTVAAGATLRRLWNQICKEKQALRRVSLSLLQFWICCCMVGIILVNWSPDFKWPVLRSNLDKQALLRKRTQFILNLGIIPAHG